MAITLLNPCLHALTTPISNLTVRQQIRRESLSPMALRSNVSWGPSPEEAAHVGKGGSSNTTGSMPGTPTDASASHGDSVSRHYIAPAYQESWKQIFISERYRPKAIRFMSFFMAIYFLGNGALDWLNDTGHDGEWGGYDWMVRASVARPLGGILSLLIAVVFFLPRCQPFCVRHHDLLCTVWLVDMYMTTMVISFLDLVSSRALK